MPTLKYKDPVTGEYKSDIRVVGAVSSVNGKTGVVELTNSDITNAITDVQINGASVVVDGVASIPVALQTSIDARSSGRVLQCSDIPYAVKSAMISASDPAWTASEQAAARARIGFDKYELIADVSIAESVSSIDVPVDFTKYKEIAISFFMFTDSAKTIRFGVRDKYNATYLLTYDTPGANVGFFCDTSIEPGEDAYSNASSNKKFMARSTSSNAASWTSRSASYNRATIYSGYRPTTSRRYDEMTHVHATVNSGQTIPAGASIMVYGRR